MDTLTLTKLSLNPFYFQPKPTRFSFFKTTKTKTSHVSLSHKTPPSIPHHNPKQPFKPFTLLVPILHHFKKWFLKLQSHIDQYEKALLLQKQQQEAEKRGLLKSGSLGLALSSVTSNAKVRISPFIATLAANPTFVSGLFAWLCAQSMKVCLNFFVEKKWDWRILFTSGGMPSSHSALCTALTTSVALCHGVADSLFPVCLGFSLIVMYDAIGVRRHAGMQAEVLNMIVEDLFQGHPISQRKLKELLGHTPSQVLAGAVLGILVACLCCQGCLVVT